MPVLDIERLKTLAPVKAHSVSVPELGADTVAWVAELTADERDLRYEIGFEEHQKACAAERKAHALTNGKDKDAAVLGDTSKVGLRAWFVAACLCDEHRNFLCKTLEDISVACEALGKLDSRPITRLFAKAQEVNAVSAAELEAIEKN